MVGLPPTNTISNNPCLVLIIMLRLIPKQGNPRVMHVVKPDRELRDAGDVAHSRRVQAC